MNVFPSSSTKTLYLRSVRCRDRSSSITRRICSWFCAAYAACTTYRLVVMIIWNPLLFSWTKLSCSAILDKRVFIRSRKQLYEFLLMLSRGLPERTAQSGAVWNEGLMHRMDRQKHAHLVQRRARGIKRIASILDAAETVLPKLATTRLTPIVLQLSQGSLQAPCINSSPTKRRLHKPWLLVTPRNSNRCMALFSQSRLPRFLSPPGWIRSLTPCSHFTLLIPRSTSFSPFLLRLSNLRVWLMLCQKS